MQRSHLSRNHIKSQVFVLPNTFHSCFQVNNLFDYLEWILNLEIFPDWFDTWHVVRIFLRRIRSIPKIWELQICIFLNEIIFHTYLPHISHLNSIYLLQDLIACWLICCTKKVEQIKHHYQHVIHLVIILKYFLLSRFDFFIFSIRLFEFRYINTDSSHHGSIIEFDCKHFVEISYNKNCKTGLKMKSAIIFILAAIFLSVINAGTIPTKLDKKTDQIEAGVY